ncbi:Phosphatidylinositol 4-kinase pik1alpha (PI4-kinase)(PtdIns-4-kinase) [Terramyces sp. JEL0728]|nr:Phosphatidylinositol 4-kinase pik1alpha (PI4-kinase)(PtdIns-4-kinase) [Terramyces sp. JEL0728]
MSNTPKAQSKNQDHYSSLLRLFESDVFDSRLALSYLFTYPKNVGIQNYICKELSKYPESDIEFLLPQICHIIVSRPEDSASLEDFIISLCQRSNHMAIITLWYLEAYLDEMQFYTSVHSDSFQLCRRLYQQCQTIVFSETSPDIGSHLDAPARPKYDVNVSAHIPPNIVGIGLVFASFGAPHAHTHAKSMVLNQARQPRFYDPVEDEESAEDDSIQEEKVKRRSVLSDILARVPTGSPSLEEMSKGSAFSFKNFLKKTNKRAKSLDKPPSSASLVDDTREKIVTEKSSKSLEIDTTFEDKEDVRLLNSHYFHSEMQFIMALVDISERLVAFPKHARQSSLIAELTLLNHNLPANICIPFWCSAESSNQHHHQICRIALSDCVVLNSAERVPYLMLVEVIETDPHSKLDPSSPSILQKHEDSNQEETSNSEIITGVSTDSQRRNSTEYYMKVMSRRQSISEIRQKLSPSTPNSTAGLDLTGLATVAKHPIKQDEYADRMRTAAVMLAQLYQQQQKQLEALSVSIRKSRSGVLTPPRTSESGRYASAPASPQLSDKKQYTKLKNDFEEIRARVLKEMAILEAERLEYLSKELETSGIEDLLPERNENDIRNSLERDEDDPSGNFYLSVASVFREPWTVKRARIQTSSPYGNHPNWQLYSVIVKSGADLRQEQLALQLINEVSRIWKSFRIPLWVYPFRILITSAQSGLIEVIPDSVSIHSIKKEGYSRRLNQPGIAYSLYDHFIKEFGQPGCENFQKAQDNFMNSLAAYSIITYILQIHLKGHITHIDFGFMLMNSPGSVGFELAPFKLPQEYIDVLGGMHSEKFAEFRTLMKTGFLALRKRFESVISLVKIMEKDSKLPCFTGLTKPTSVQLTPTGLPVPPEIESNQKYPVTQALIDRFQLSLTDEAIGEWMDKIIDSSCNNMFTKLYDSFQYYANGIL